MSDPKPIEPQQADGAITPAGLKALHRELEELESVGRREIAKRISAARELGDLKENAEYHIAKEDQGHMETKILRLQERLRKAVVVDTPADSGVVTFGAPAEIRDAATGAVHAWTIVGPTEASLKDGKLSAESPVAQALLGHAPGDEVTVQTPRGARVYVVQSVG